MKKIAALFLVLALSIPQSVAVYAESGDQAGTEVTGQETGDQTTAEGDPEEQESQTTEGTEEQESQTTEGTEEQESQTTEEDEQEKGDSQDDPEEPPKLSESKKTINLYGLKKEKDGFYYPKDNKIVIENVSKNTEISWFSNSKKLMVSQDAKDTFHFYPKAKGEYKITFKVGKVKLKYKLKVLNAYLSFERNSLSLNDEIGKKWVSGASMICLYKGEKTSIKVIKSGISDSSKIKWTSSDTGVVKVDKKGNIKAKTYGYAQVTATYEDIVSETYLIAVTYKTAANALRYAAKHYHSTYSQPKRMWKNYYDCSSYVWRAYLSVGKHLGSSSYKTYAPTAAELARWCTENGYTIIDGRMEGEKMLPGDLLFETGAKNGRYRGIYHIDFYTGYGRRMTVARSKDYVEEGTVIVARPCMVTPSAPSVTHQDKDILVSWKASQSYGAYGYIVYRSLATEDRYVKIGKTKKESYVDKTGKKAQKYTYKIQPYWKSHKTIKHGITARSKSITAK